MPTIDQTTWVSPNHDERPDGVSAIVIHSTGGSARSGLRWLTNPASGVSAHYVIDRDGRIFQLVDDERRAWHAGDSTLAGVGDVNDYSLGVELAHADGEDYPPAQIAALTDLCRAKMAAYAIPVDRVVSHRVVALPSGRKVDPADWSEPAFRAWVDRLDDTPLPPAPDDPDYTPDSPLLAPPSARVEVALARWAWQPNAAYKAWDVEVILRAYWHQAAALDIDPALAVAQMVHETGWLTSWWCGRPRHNPAGIGVTGQTSLIPRLMSKEWAWNPNTRRWHKGLSFADWVHDAIPIHLGRLLAYALREGAGTPLQQAAIRVALARRPLPVRLRGCAPTLQGLEGTWAVPGTEYADKISAIANYLTGRQEPAVTESQTVEQQLTDLAADRDAEYGRKLDAYSESYRAFVETLIDHVQIGEVGATAIREALGGLLTSRKRLDNAQLVRVLGIATMHQLATLIGGTLELRMGRIEEKLDQLLIARRPEDMTE